VTQQAIAKGKLAAAFFLLKTQFGWRENIGFQPLGKDGQPIDLNSLDNSSLEQLLTALTAGGAGDFSQANIRNTEEGWPIGVMVPPSRTTN
jgi:hypothetical protein